MRRVGCQSTVSGGGIRAALRVQEIFCAAGASQRPVVLLPPLIKAHDKNLHWLLRELILNAFEQIVIPVNFILPVLSGGGAEVDVTNLAALPGMAANRHDEMLSTACRLTAPVPLQSQVIPQRPALKDVVPGGDSQRGNIDV